MPLHRVFIAFPMSDEAKDELKKIQNELKSLNRENGISWSKSEGMHITLEFLGEITTDFITQTRLPSPCSGIGGQVAQILKTLSAKYMAFKFKLESVDAFPNKHNPRVIVVKVRDEAGESYKIQKELHNELRALNLELDEKNWSPHITLGRNKFDNNVNGLDSVKIDPIKWEVGEIELIESELMPEGPRYTILENFSLQ